MRILLVEDQGLVRGAIRALLELEPGIEVVAEAADGLEAWQWLEQCDVDEHPDIVLTDIEMPNLSGLDLIDKMQTLASSMQPVIMTTFSRAGYIKRAVDAGVRGFILKEAPTDYLINALKKVKQGQRVIDPELALSAVGEIDPLSDKERKALKLAGEGMKTADIAKQLFLSEGTVRNYLSEAIAKLGAANRIDAARIAHQKGWL